MIIKHDFGNTRIKRSSRDRQQPVAETLTRTLFIGFGGLLGFQDQEGSSATTLFMSCNRLMAMTSGEFVGHAPNLVLTPLVCGPRDAVDFAQKLASLGFCGRYRAVVDSLPNIHLVRQEIRATCPSIDFDVIELSGRDIRKLSLEN
ncbi:MAG: hypothetical protein KDA67_05050 [Rhodobacteraceae bacterium]|nr:hypothetical protein [Paracoccaceae bacterium]